MKHVLLGDIAKISSGGTPDRARPEYWDGHIPWVKTGEIQFGIIRDAEEKITERALNESSAKLVPAGSLLMAMYGQGKTRGQVALLGIDAAINQACAAISPHDSEDSRYLFQFLAANYENVRRLSNSGSQENLNAELIRGIRLFYPTKPERQQIADILGTWDEALEKLNALVAANDRRKKALMQQLLSGKRRLPKYRAKPWRNLRMADALSRVFRPVGLDGSAPLPLVSIRRRYGGLFRRPDILASEYKTQDLHVLKAGDFLISKRQVVHGAWAFVEPGFEGTLVSKEYAILINHAPDALNMRFFGWLAQTPRMLRLARVASTGVHIEKLIFDPDVFLREQIRVPTTVAEQSAIADVLDAAAAELCLLRQQRTALDRQKRGLMQRLLTGKLRVNT